MTAKSPARIRVCPQVILDEPVAVLGDIHGRVDLLWRLLARLPPAIPLVVVGDVGDRGLETSAVIATLAHRGALGVSGEHDAWLVQWAGGGGFDASMALYRGMGGVATLRSYGVKARNPAAIAAQHRRVPEGHRRWLSTLSVGLDLVVCGEPFLVTHAGVPPWREVGRPDDWERIAAECVGGLRMATLAIASGQDHFSRASLRVYLSLVRVGKPYTLVWPWNLEDDDRGPTGTVVMGHFPLRRPLDTGSVIALDTGCGSVRGGTLTAVVLPDRRFISVGRE